MVQLFEIELGSKVFVVGLKWELYEISPLVLSTACECLTIFMVQIYDIYTYILWQISGFCCGINGFFAVLGCYAAHIGSYLLMLWDSLLVPSYRVKMRLIACPKTSVNNYKSMLCNIPEEQRHVELDYRHVCIHWQYVILNYQKELSEHTVIMWTMSSTHWVVNFSHGKVFSSHLQDPAVSLWSCLPLPTFIVFVYPSWKTEH